jgi:hypothetical protein
VALLRAHCRWLVCGVFCWVWALVQARAALAAGPAEWQWGPLRQLAVMNLDAPNPVALRPIAAEAPAAIAPRELLLIPVRAGQTVRIDAGKHHWGYGFGPGAVPHSVTWHPASESPHDVRVPSWGSARFVVVRVDEPSRVSVQMAMRVWDPLALVRRDDRVRSWLREPNAALLTEAGGAEGAQLALLGALRDGLRRAAGALSAARARQTHEAIGEVLFAEWLATQYEERPLVPPFFLPAALPAQKVLSQPASPWVAVEDELGQPGAELASGESINWSVGNADVVEFELEAAADACHFVAAQGKHVIEQRWPALASVTSFRPGRRVRMVLRSNEPLRLTVLSGRLRVFPRAFSAEEALIELRARRSPRALLERAARRLAAADSPTGEASSSDVALAAVWQAVARAARASDRGQPARGVGQLSPELTALHSALSLPELEGEAQQIAALERFWRQTDLLPSRQRDSLRQWVLWKVNEAWPVLGYPTAGHLREPLTAFARAASEQQRPLLQALVDGLVPAIDGGRSRSAAELEQRTSLVEQWPGLAAQTWRRAAPWVTQWPAVGAKSVLDWKEPKPPGPGEDCPVVGPEGTRWTVLGSAPVVYTAATTWGTHRALRMHPLPRPSPSPDNGGSGLLPQDSVVQIDEQQFSVLPLLGVGSGVGLSAGEHRLRVVGGDPVLVQLPRDGRAPCESLRIAERWTELESSAVFAAPTGDVPTVANITLEPHGAVADAKAPVTVEVQVGGVRYEAWLLAPGASFEVPVAAGVTGLQVRTRVSGRARVRAREQRTLRVAPVDERKDSSEGTSPQSTQPPGAGDEFTGLAGPVAPQWASMSEAGEQDSVAPEPLQQLRRLSRTLLAESRPDKLDALRTERAELLTRLGYRRLADLDRSRRASASHPPGSSEEPLGRSQANSEVWLPHRAEPVLALDRAPELPILADDVAPAALQAAYDEIRRGAVARAHERLVEAGAEQNSGRAALALAHAFERNGEFQRAAVVYERLARATGQLGLVVRAASSLTAAALQSGDRGTLTRAHWLARRAIELGARPAPLLGPIAPYLEWDSPTLSALGFGDAKVAQSGEADEIVTEAMQVRAALLDKPPLARWYSPEASLNLSELSGDVEVTSLCFEREGPAEACNFEARIDGAAVRCAPQPRNVNAVSSVGRVAQCRFTVPRGARRLRWAAPDALEPMGWLLVQTRDATGAWQVLPQTLSYTEATPGVPLVLDVAGPAVLRVTARAKPGREARVEVRVTDSSGKLVGVPRRSTLPRVRDPGAQRVDVPSELGRAVSDVILIEGRGQHTVSVSSDSGEVLIRPELARVRTPDVVAISSEQPLLLGPQLTSNAGAVALDVPRVAQLPALPKLALSADLGVADHIETDETTQDVRAEAGLTLRKALIEEQLWLRTQLQARLRDGPPSGALEVHTSWAAREQSPGFYARARMAGQPVPSTGAVNPNDAAVVDDLGAARESGTALGYYAALGGSHHFSLTERATLVPAFGAVFRAADSRLRGIDGADSEVYSAYARTHPRSWDAQLSVAYRPRFDALTFTTVQLRLNPALEAVDYLEGRFSAHWLGGSGYWPWLSWQTSFTWYQSSELRDTAFVRIGTSPVVQFWRWLESGDRVRAKFSCGAQWDEPSPKFVQPTLLAFFGLGYDFGVGHGLRDFAPFERPFRRRLEEGSRRVTTRNGGSNAHWAWDEVP